MLGRVVFLKSFIYYLIYIKPWFYLGTCRVSMFIHDTVTVSLRHVMPSDVIILVKMSFLSTCRFNNRIF